MNWKVTCCLKDLQYFSITNFFNAFLFLITGFAGGKIAKYRQSDITNVEMSNLSEKKSNDDSKSETNENSWLPWNWNWK